MFLRLIEILLLITAGIFIGSQILAPLWNGRPIFPLFGLRRVLERDLAQKAESDELKAMRDRLRTRSKKNSPPDDTSSTLH